MNWMMKNSHGEPDAMFTCAMVAFFVVTLRILLGLIGSIKFNEHALVFKDMDASIITAYLGLSFSAYWARRHTKATCKDKKVSK